MFNKSYHTYRGGDTVVTGVGAPEAARFLKDIETESAGRIDEVIFDRLECPEYPLEWACVVERSAVENCLCISIYYNAGEGRRKITLPTIKQNERELKSRNAILNEIAKDMSANITKELLRVFTKPGF